MYNNLPGSFLLDDTAAVLNTLSKKLDFWGYNYERAISITMVALTLKC